MKHIFKGVDDICVIIVVVACCVFIGCGINSEVMAIFGMAVGYLFGKNSPAIVEKLKQNKT